MKLNFVSAGAAQGLVAKLARGSQVEVAGSFGAVGAMLERFRAGEACDVVILTHTQIAELSAEGRVDGRSCADLGSVPTAIAVKESDPAPDVSGERALRAALLDADAIYFPDPTRATAGIHFAKVVQALGIHAGVAGNFRTFPNGTTAMKAMAEAEGHPIGCTQATEILATPGVKLVAALPAGFDLETVYTAAVSRDASHPEAAARFVDTLAGEAARAVRTAAGFRGYAIRRASPADGEAVRRVVHGVLAEYGLEPEAGGIDADIENLDKGYFAPGGTFEVAIAADGTIAGCCGVVPIDATLCELRKMYLMPGARGFGLGGRLLRRALSFAKGRGFSRMELETASVLKEAIALYAGAGFAPIERRCSVARCDQAFGITL